MAKYLISFPSAAMVVPDSEWGAVGRDAHAVIDEAKAAGVYVFGGGIDEDVPPVLVSADGTVAMGGYPWAPTLDGGFTVLELPSRDEAIAWAAQRRYTYAQTLSPIAVVARFFQMYREEAEQAPAQHGIRERAHGHLERVGLTSVRPRHSSSTATPHPAIPSRFPMR